MGWATTCVVTWIVVSWASYSIYKRLTVQNSLLADRLDRLAASVERLERSQPGLALSPAMIADGLAEHERRKREYLDRLHHLGANHPLTQPYP